MAGTAELDRLDTEQQERWKLVEAAGVHDAEVDAYLPFILEDERPCGHRGGELDEHGMCIAPVRHGYGICGCHPVGGPVELEHQH